MQKIKKLKELKETEEILSKNVHNRDASFDDLLSRFF